MTVMEVFQDMGNLLFRSDRPVLAPFLQLSQGCGSQRRVLDISCRLMSQLTSWLNLKDSS